VRADEQHVHGSDRQPRGLGFTARAAVHDAALGVVDVQQLVMFLGVAHGLPPGFQRGTELESSSQRSGATSESMTRVVCATSMWSRSSSGRWYWGYTPSPAMVWATIPCLAST